jgi:pyruvate,water dikinase
MARFAQAPMLEGFGAGFASSTARFGLLLDQISPGISNDFVYSQPIPFGAPPGAIKPPPKLIFQLITRLVPKLRARIRRSHDAITQKLWRADLARWDNEVRPASDKRHKELQAIDPGALDDAVLIAHVKACRDRLAEMVRQHHEFTITCALPIGDLLAHVLEWTGKPMAEVLPLLRGTSKISCGVAATELGTLAAELRNDAAAQALLGGDDAIDKLRAHPGAVGTAMRAYLDVVSYRCLGYDIGSKSMIEMPEMIVRAIRAAVDGAASTPQAADEAAARIATLRAAVPEPHRAMFDELLGEARFINRLRDERGHYSDGWATGIARRVVLEAGRRLARRGTIPDADHALDCSYEELAELFAGKPGPGADELTRRNTWRTTRSVTDPDVPPWLVAMPGGPPPVEWLPAHGRRAQRATNVFLQGMFHEPAVERTATTVKGLPVSPGNYEGVARLVTGETDFARIQKGDVLVTRSTSPYFNVVLPLLGAIVTDRGGQLCHAAIVSREYGIPGVVGTREATQLIADGARVRVDGTTGVVTVL